MAERELYLRELYKGQGENEMILYILISIHCLITIILVWRLFRVSSALDWYMDIYIELALREQMKSFAGQERGKTK